jgi:hypothetical protein
MTVYLMLGSHRGTPALSLFSITSFLFGPVIVMIRSDLCEKPESSFHHPLAQIIVPPNIVVLYLIVIVLFSIRHLELIIGTFATLWLAVISLTADFLTRVFLSSHYQIERAGSGPYALMMTLFSLYCIYMPTVNAYLIAANEKVVLLAFLLCSVVFDTPLSLIPLFVGFLVFVLVAPLFARRP